MSAIILRLPPVRPAVMPRAPASHPDSARGGACRRGHRPGNALLSGLVRRVFGDRVSDVLSGYRVVSRRFVTSVPALAAGFETETESTGHALALTLPIGETSTRDRERPAGSASRPRTILVPGKGARPLSFFAAAGAVLLACLAFACGVLLGSVARGRQEIKRLANLAQPAPPAP